MDLDNPRHRAHIADESREFAKAARESAKFERSRGNHDLAAEDERIARGFDAKARRSR
jgi:hypothetical protein